MKVMLYDEAMYPSGSCHGQVVQENPEFASLGLIRQELSGEKAGRREGRGKDAIFFSTGEKMSVRRRLGCIPGIGRDTVRSAIISNG